jgi:uncharacterized membrane protein YgdD (TMEM256/DUF423 family)
MGGKIFGQLALWSSISKDSSQNPRSDERLSRRVAVVILTRPSGAILCAMIDRSFFALGSLFAFLAVGVGAFGAHALKDSFGPGMAEVFETGVRYQFYHAIALFAVAYAVVRWPSSSAGLAGWLFIAGIILFSGSLYALSLTGIRVLGAITPLGGLAFLAGWAVLGWTVLRG